MTKTTRIVLYVSLLVAGSPWPVRGQTYTCLPNTAEEAEVLYNTIVSLVTGTDSLAVATRNAYQLPAVAASKVNVITTSSTCTRAGAAYHAAVTPPGTPAVSRTLVVIKVGTTRYVVVDPNQRAGRFMEHEVFDSHWTLLIGWT